MKLIANLEKFTLRELLIKLSESFIIKKLIIKIKIIIQFFKIKSLKHFIQ